MELKLQIKDSGAWRNVMSFTAHTEPRIKMLAAEMMGFQTNPKAALRIVKPVNGYDQVKAWCEGPNWAWKKPQF
jgi:hypothetical protein